MTQLNLIGYLLAFLAVCWYNYTKFQSVGVPVCMQGRGGKDVPYAQQPENAIPLALPFHDAQMKAKAAMDISKPEPPIPETVPLKSIGMRSPTSAHRAA